MDLSKYNKTARKKSDKRKDKRPEKIQYYEVKPENTELICKRCGHDGFTLSEYTANTYMHYDPEHKVHTVRIYKRRLRCKNCGAGLTDIIDEPDSKFTSEFKDYIAELDLNDRKSRQEMKLHYDLNPITTGELVEEYIKRRDSEHRYVLPKKIGIASFNVDKRTKVILIFDPVEDLLLDVVNTEQITHSLIYGDSSELVPALSKEERDKVDEIILVNECDLLMISGFFENAGIYYSSEAIKQMGKQALFEDAKSFKSLNRQVKVEDMIFNEDPEAFEKALKLDTRVLLIKANLDKLSSEEYYRINPTLSGPEGSLPHYEHFLESIYAVPGNEDTPLQNRHTKEFILSAQEMIKGFRTYKNMRFSQQRGKILYAGEQTYPVLDRNGDPVINSGRKI